MQEIDLIPGTAGKKEAAFSLGKMEAAGIDAASLSEALGTHLSPFTALLADGCGIAIILRGDGASVIGLRTDE